MNNKIKESLALCKANWKTCLLWSFFFELLLAIFSISLILAIVKSNLYFIFIVGFIYAWAFSLTGLQQSLAYKLTQQSLSFTDILIKTFKCSWKPFLTTAIFFAAYTYFFFTITIVSKIGLLVLILISITSYAWNTLLILQPTGFFKQLRLSINLCRVYWWKKTIIWFVGNAALAIIWILLIWLLIIVIYSFGEHVHFGLGVIIEFIISIGLLTLAIFFIYPLYVSFMLLHVRELTNKLL